jgi:hypothetical protein
VLRRDERGVVYVEFLLAFFPVFILFLGICQLALIATAGAVVRHAAYAAARSAIVVLEDAPCEYDSAADCHDGVARGDVTHGAPAPSSGLTALLAALGEVGSAPPSDPGDASAPAGQSTVLQQGARMAPIRTAAYMPLLVLAPSSGPERTHPTSLSASLPSNLASQLSFALAYTESAAVVTLHTERGTEALAPEPISPNANVTVRVSYLYQCNIPVVRVFVCRTLNALTEAGDSTTTTGKRAAELAARMQLAEAPAALDSVAGSAALFYELRGEVTLPNQGAAYEHPRGG